MLKGHDFDLNIKELHVRVFLFAVIMYTKLDFSTHRDGWLDLFRENE
jgi:hypothetical protein